MYGSSISFYEEYDEDLLTEAQEKALNLHKYRLVLLDSGVRQTPAETDKWTLSF